MMARELGGLQRALDSVGCVAFRDYWDSFHHDWDLRLVSLSPYLVVSSHPGYLTSTVTRVNVTRPNAYAPQNGIHPDENKRLVLAG